MDSSLLLRLLSRLSNSGVIFNIIFVEERDYVRHGNMLTDIVDIHTRLTCEEHSTWSPYEIRRSTRPSTETKGTIVRRFQFTLFRSGCQVKIDNSTGRTFSWSEKCNLIFTGHIYSVVNRRIPLLWEFPIPHLYAMENVFNITKYVMVKRWKIMYWLFLRLSETLWHNTANF